MCVVTNFAAMRTNWDQVRDWLSSPAVIASFQGVSPNFLVRKLVTPDGDLWCIELVSLDPNAPQGLLTTLKTLCVDIGSRIYISRDLHSRLTPAQQAEIASWGP